MLNRFFALFLILILFSCAPIIEGFNEEYYRNENTYSDYSEYASDYTQHPNNTEYQSILEETVKDGCPGLAVLVSDEFGIWAGASGVVDFQTNVSWRTNTICRIGSISKTFCSTLLLLLQEDGLIDLDTPLNDILSDDILKGIPNTNATVRQLLSHTSGIPNYTNELDFMTESGVFYPTTSPTAQEALNYIRNKKADFEVGTDWNYSNTNYVLAEMVIEKVTNRESHTALKERIFDPLNLVSTYYDPDNPFPEGLPRGYSDFYGNGNYTDITNYDCGLSTLDGGIISTIFDLNTFINSLFYNRDFISEQSFSEMSEMNNAGENQKYGLGLFMATISEQEWFGHSGGHLSYSAYMIHDFKNKKSYTMLTNSINFTSDVLHEFLEKI